MKFGRPPLSTFFFSKYIWIGVSLGILYWILESLVHVFVFQEGLFFSQLLTLDPHEVWKRVVVASLLFVFSLYAQHGINARRRTEEALKTSEKKYRTLFQEALNPVFVFDENGRILEHNQATRDFFECSDETFSKNHYQDVIKPGKLRDSVVEFPLRFDRGNAEIDYGVHGRTKTLLVNVVPVTIGGFRLYYGIGQDITERKRMVRNMVLAHAELNQIFQTASVAMRLIDRDFNVLKINETFAALCGVPPEDAVGRKCHDVFAGDMCHTPRCPLTRIVNGEPEIEYELEKRRRDGTSVPCLLIARPFVGDDGKVVGIVESFKDITELQRVQEEVRAERDKLRHILFQQFEGVGILRPDLTIEYQNATLREQIGDCEGRKCYTAFRERKAPCTPCYLEKAIRTGKLQRCEFDASSGRSYEHTYTPFEEADGESKVVVLLRDITELKASRAAVIRSEQFAALGELAAGVAHEINNPINGIINYGQMLVSRNRERQMVQEIAMQIVKEGDRVAKIVESLLSFSRREKHLHMPVHIGAILEDSLTLTGAQMRKDAIRLNTNVPADLPKVVCVPQEVQQVFLNILSNARFALNEKYPNSHPAKTLDITAEVEEVGSIPTHVRLSFRDTGIGIPAEIIDKVMNPFFSTKPRGKGTGLGLSISHGIISEQGGKLSIESVVGEFTRVDVLLPATI